MSRERYDDKCYERSVDLLSSMGLLRSLVTVFFNLAPLQMSVNRALLPCCSDRFKDGFSVLACSTHKNIHSLRQKQARFEKTTSDRDLCVKSIIVG